MADFSQLLYGSAPVGTAPAGTRTPGQGLPGALRDKALDRAANAAEQRLTSLEDVLSQGADNLTQLNEFVRLNKLERTGGLHEGLMSSFFPESFRGSNEKLMQAIPAQIAPTIRPVGSGSTSDRDMTLYLQSLPSIALKGEANRKIRDNYQKQYDKARAKVDFLREWYNANGHLNGADSAWASQNKPSQQKDYSGWSIQPLDGQ
jgi:hypothetical protein